MTTYVHVSGTLNRFYFTNGYTWLCEEVGRGNWKFKYLDFGILFEDEDDAIMFKLKFGNDSDDTNFVNQNSKYIP
jgi:hypothetical protein